jgi:hypothetical protein
MSVVRTVRLATGPRASMPAEGGTVLMWAAKITESKGKDLIVPDRELSGVSSPRSRLRESMGLMGEFRSWE